MRKKDDKVGNKMAIKREKKGKRKGKRKRARKKLKQIRKKSPNFGLIAHARKNDNAGLA